MMGWYHEIGAEALPSAFLLAKLHAPWFEWAFQLAVMLTLVDTGVALLHAINERVAKAYEERRRPMPQRPLLPSRQRPRWSTRATWPGCSSPRRWCC